MDTFLYILEMFSAVAMVLGLIMAIMGIWFFTTKHRMKNCTAHTKGVLVKIHIGTRRHSADYMQFDYQVNGQTVRGTVTFEYIEDLSYSYIYKALLFQGVHCVVLCHCCHVSSV